MKRAIEHYKNLNLTAFRDKGTRFLAGNSHRENYRDSNHASQNLECALQISCSAITCGDKGTKSS